MASHFSERLSCFRLFCFFSVLGFFGTVNSESTAAPSSSPPPSYFSPTTASTVSPNSSIPDGPCRDNHPLCRKPNSGSGFLIGGGLCLFLIMGSSVIAAVYCRRRNPPITEGAAHAAQALIKMEGPYTSVQVAMPGNSYPSHLAWPDVPEGSSKGGTFFASPDSTAHSLQGSLHGNCSWRGGNNSYEVTLFRPFRELGGEGETETGRGTEMCDLEKGSSTIKASLSQNNQAVCLSEAGTEIETRSEMEMRTGTGMEMGTGSRTGVESRLGVGRGTETERSDIKMGASASGSSLSHLSQLQSTDSEEVSSNLERMGPTRGSSDALKALQWAQVEEEGKVANEGGVRGHL